MKTSEALDGAADLIEARGWWDGTDSAHYGVTEHLCAVTAIGDAACLDGVALRGAFTRFEANVGMKIERWNDAPGRTKDEVVERLRKVAAEARWTEVDLEG